MKRTSAVTTVMLLLCTAAGAVNVTILWDQWPYGRRNIGTSFQWWMSPTGSHVTVPAFHSSDTIWDLVGLGGSAVSHEAESDIRPRSEAEGSPPSLCTYAEKQTFDGQVSWGYEHLDTSRTVQWMWLYGIYDHASGIEADYLDPYDQVYQFPMRLGNAWTSAWSWNFEGVDSVFEMRDNWVVAQGWVRVPADSSRYCPCLVLRTHSISNDELGLIDENRIDHEWLVPVSGQVGGSVATIESQNHTTDTLFTDAEYVFKMKAFHPAGQGIGGDRVNVPGPALSLPSLNPASIDLAIPAASRVEVAIYDIRGSRVFSVPAREVAAGCLRQPIPSRLPSGLYVAVVDCSGARERRSFSVVH